MQGYDGFCRDLDRRAASPPSRPRAARRCSGSGCPTAPITFDDLVRGEVTFQPEHVPDFALVRANGHPLYTLVNPVDDALMGITHVLRGEDLLSSTPRQIALYEALEAIGIGTGAPRFGHLPDRDGRGQQAAVQARPRAPACSTTSSAASSPRACSTTWRCSAGAIADDRDVFTMAEMVEAFDIRRVNPNPARFDLKKLEAINAAHMRLLSVEELTARVMPYLQAAACSATRSTPSRPSCSAARCRWSTSG